MKITEWLYGKPATNSQGFFSGTSRPVKKRPTHKYWYDHIPEIRDRVLPRPTLSSYERTALPNFSMEEMEQMARRSEERNMKKGKV